MQTTYKARRTAYYRAAKKWHRMAQKRVFLAQNGTEKEFLQVIAWHEMAQKRPGVSPSPAQISPPVGIVLT